MLTDEQITAIKTAITVFEQRAALGDHSHSRHLQVLLAAHNAGVQEPVAEIVRWLDFTNKPRFDIKVIDKTLEHGAKLYSQPMTQTDSAGARASSGSLAFNYGNALVDKKLDPSYNTHPQPMPQTDSAGAQEEPYEPYSAADFTLLVAKNTSLRNEVDALRAENLRLNEELHMVDLASDTQPMPQTDSARDAKDAKRYRLLRERYFTRADNPNTSAYHCVGVFTSWLPAATIDRDGLDAVLDAEIERLDGAKGE